MESRNRHWMTQCAASPPSLRHWPPATTTASTWKLFTTARGEIERMLAMGRKIEHGVAVMVDDDQEEEYRQYHGFGMGGMTMG